MSNRTAFLDTIAFSELGRALIAMSDNGYNVCVGSTPAKPIFFQDYSHHPEIRCEALNSDAAGRYQIMGRYYLPYKKQLRLPDFGHASQDAIALQMIKECHALFAIDTGDFDGAVHLCRSRWASFPDAGYAQHENKIESLRAVFVRAGGKLA